MSVIGQRTAASVFGSEAVETRVLLSHGCVCVRAGKPTEAEVWKTQAPEVSYPRGGGGGGRGAVRPHEPTHPPTHPLTCQRARGGAGACLVSIDVCQAPQGLPAVKSALVQKSGDPKRSAQGR